MGYTMLKGRWSGKGHEKNSLKEAAVSFLREDCQDLRFDEGKSLCLEDPKLDFDGTSLKKGQIPYNMQMDLDRLCLENAVDRFLGSGKKEDAFDVYFCYLEMFIGDYEKTRRMIELLSEYESNGSRLLMKHRDHYSHSVYVFALGLAVYHSNSIYREQYNNQYHLADEHQAACHYLQYWGLASLFHDIGYPFELPFEQVTSYFEVSGDRRADRPFVAYRTLESLIAINGTAAKGLKGIYGDREFANTNELFAHVLAEALGEAYHFTEETMLECLAQKPVYPDKFNHFMDHAYFSSALLFRKLFVELGCELTKAHLDALTAILMHNSLYKFDIAHYKNEGNTPLQAQLHPLAYMLMLCDELQCWDRIAYGRNSRNEIHPMGCCFDFSEKMIKAFYLFDEKEAAKIRHFEGAYEDWEQKREGKAPELKAYSNFYITDSDGVSRFQKDIERIVDLTGIRLQVGLRLEANSHTGSRSILSDSNYIHLYQFAVVLNGRWGSSEWKKARKAGQEEAFLQDKAVMKKMMEAFEALSLEYKLSNINQAKAFANYMDEIGCFYTDKEVDFEVLEEFSPQELVKIGVLEHQRWLQEHYDMGWSYGTPPEQKRDLFRQHKDLIPDFGERGRQVSIQQARANYDRLDKGEQDKDTEPMECMLAMLRMFDGLRIYRLK